MVIKRFEVWQIDLDPSIGAEISKKRPCLIISPNEANKFLNTVIVIPLTSTIRKYPTRVNCIFEKKSGQLAIDQMRSIDKSRLEKRLGVLDEKTSRHLCSVVVETFKF